MSGTIRVKCARCGYNKRFETGGFYGEEVAARAERRSRMADTAGRSPRFINTAPRPACWRNPRFSAARTAGI